MQRINLTGGWVELRDPKEVPEGLRRPVVQASIDAQRFADLDEADFTGADMNQLQVLNDLAAVALVKTWSFDSSISLEGLLELPSGAYDELLASVAPKVADLMPNFGVNPDPKAPTEDSVD
jgi:hypothetical protein